MHYVKIPEPVELSSFKADNGPIFMSLNDLLINNVWIDDFWRKDKSKLEMFFVLVKKYENKKPGQWVGHTDEEWEVFFPKATLQGVKLNAQFVIPMNKLMSCFFEAKTEKPEDYDTDKLDN